jgi:glycerol-3-phosphate acyltransferase PlsY
MSPDTEALHLNLARVCAGLGAILGHVFPVYLRFKGGKGVATSAGVLSAVRWEVVAVLFPVWALVVLVSKYVSLASITAAAAAPVTYAVFSGADAFGPALPGLVFCSLLTLLVVIRHRSNIGRLVRGTESKVLVKKTEEA